MNNSLPLEVRIFIYQLTEDIRVRFRVSVKEIYICPVCPEYQKGDSLHQLTLNRIACQLYSVQKEMFQKSRMSHHCTRTTTESGQ